eukprot:GFKZ01015396.1.p2 GENE.GFKZ01015396.1~~GFKZ01015396.1.p2  ORF type:complete len:231 (-),score=47.75 GFKZ01015396.1:97-789(-)
MMVVKVGAAVEGEPAVERPGEVVAGMALDGLHAAEGEVCVQGEEMRADEVRAGEGGHAEEDDLERVCVLCGDAEGGGVLVMDRVNGLVEIRGVECAVTPVEDKVLDEEEKEDLEKDGGDCGEGVEGVGTVDVVEDWVGGEDHGEDKEEVVEQDTAEAVGLQRGGVLLVRLDLVAAEVWNLVGEEEGQVGGPVKEFMNEKSDGCLQLRLRKCRQGEAPEGFDWSDAGHVAE